MTTMIKLVLAAAVAATAANAIADDAKPYKEGPVTDLGYIRTKAGHFTDYMKYLDTTWKTEMEAYKKAGLILDYKVYVARPRSASDPDLVLAMTYPNWAAFDRVGDFEAIDAKIEGSLQAAEKGVADRQSIRDILGSDLVQELNLK